MDWSIKMVWLIYFEMIFKCFLYINFFMIETLSNMISNVIEELENNFVSLILSFFSLIITILISNRQKHREMFDFKLNVIESVEKLFQQFKLYNKSFGKNRIMCGEILEKKYIDYDKLNFQIDKVFGKTVLQNYRILCKKCKEIEHLNLILIEMQSNALQENNGEIESLMHLMQKIYSFNEELTKDDLKEYDTIFYYNHDTLFSDAYVRLTNMESEIEKSITNFIDYLKNQTYCIK